MKTRYATPLPAVLALLLCACGGGGSGGGVQSTPAPPQTPTPTPTPTPAPAPTPPPLPAGALGLSAGPFVTAAASLDNITGEWPKTTAETLATGPDLVGISYSAADNSYTLSLPAYGSGTLRPISGNGSYQRGSSTWQRLTSVSYELMPPNGTAAPVLVVMDYPPDKDLSYTSVGRWIDTSRNVPPRAGIFAYGQATDLASMPVSGTARYAGSVQAYTRSFFDVWGGVGLNFDFGAGTLSGSMTLEISDGWDALPLGVFTFQNTVYSKGSTTFSGSIAAPGADTLGNFAGRFTGPGAPELLGSFRSPFLNPLLKSPDEIAGVFVGKRQ